MPGHQFFCCNILLFVYNIVKFLILVLVNFWDFRILVKSPPCGADMKFFSRIIIQG